MKPPPDLATRGFTLIELAVVLVIVALALGSILIPLNSQVEQRKITDSRKALEEIREALIGFAVINGRLPCPDTDADPTAVGYGEENTPCSAAPATEGFLPWKTLGVVDMDAFGVKRTGVASPRLGDWRYRVDRNFAQTFALNTVFGGDQLTVQDGAGNTLTTTLERPLAIVFSAGPNQIPDGHNASFEAANGIYQSDVQSANFDDMVIWLTRPILFNRMVTAGKLP